MKKELSELTTKWLSYEDIMNFFGEFELDNESDEYCGINIISMLQTLKLGDDAINELLQDAEFQVEIGYDIAYCLAEYATKEYGGEWDYHYSEDCAMAWDKNKCEWRDGDVYSKKNE